jgi:predicted transposase YbfD/YdcC
MPKRPTKDPKFIELTQEIDLNEFAKSVKGSFPDTEDPRCLFKTKYPFWFLMLLILCGYLGGANTISDLHIYAEFNIDWINEMIGQKFSPPSYSTFWWLLTRLSPSVFKQLLKKWFASIPQQLRDQLLVIDGKRLKGISSDGHIVHLVELFAAKQRLVLAQEKVPDKSSEPKVVDALLKDIDVSGAIISLDALFAQISIAQKFLNHGADYLIGLKGNQRNFHAEARNFFNQAREVEYKGVKVERYVSPPEKSHGRIEQRSICVCTSLDWLPQAQTWPGLQTVIEVLSERTIKGKQTSETRYYFSSRKASAKEFEEWIRDHWLIENPLHWVLDVIFEEDAAQAKTGFTDENMALFRRLSMNIIRMVHPGQGLAMARRCCTYSPRYVRGILGKIFINQHVKSFS